MGDFLLVLNPYFMVILLIFTSFCRNPSFGLATKARGCKEARESKGRKPESKGKGIGRVRAKKKPGSHHILPGV
jgi:hypothetical protein